MISIHTPTCLPHPRPNLMKTDTWSSHACDTSLARLCLIGLSCSFISQLVSSVPGVEGDDISMSTLPMIRQQTHIYTGTGSCCVVKSHANLWNEAVVGNTDLYLMSSAHGLCLLCLQIHSTLWKLFEFSWKPLYLLFLPHSAFWGTAFWCKQTGTVCLIKKENRVVSICSDSCYSWTDKNSSINRKWKRHNSKWPVHSLIVMRNASKIL